MNRPLCEQTVSPVLDGLAGMSLQELECNCGVIERWAKRSRLGVKDRPPAGERGAT